jgi:hypothetical protein
MKAWIIFLREIKKNFVSTRGNKLLDTKRIGDFIHSQFFPKLVQHVYENNDQQGYFYKFGRSKTKAIEWKNVTIHIEVVKEMV